MDIHSVFIHRDHRKNIEKALKNEMKSTKRSKNFLISSALHEWALKRLKAEKERKEKVKK